MPDVIIQINGKKVFVSSNYSVLDAVRAIKVPIPTLCNHPLLSSYGGCRLCVVEIKGIPKPITACTTPVSNGMEVLTHTPKLEEIRRTVLELLLSDHPQDCLLCESSGNCSLQELAYFYKIRQNRFTGIRRVYDDQDNNPFIKRDMQKCILCGRCVRICDEIQGLHAIDFTNRGFYTKITTAYEMDLKCEFCGQCVSVCPTGALTGKQWLLKGRIKDVSKVDTICPYCGVGCQVTLHVKDNEVIKVTSSFKSHNKGLLCVKGRFGYTFVNHPERLKYPLIRIKGKDKDSFTKDTTNLVFKETSWQEALEIIKIRLKEIIHIYGSDSIFGLSSSRCTNEENYLFQKFMRAVIGTNNIDHCARLCHAPTVAGLSNVFGSGAMTNSIEEIEDMEVIFIIGSNTKESHPVIANRMIMAHKKGAMIIIADPRVVEMVKFADVFLNLRPGTDIALLNAIAHVIVKEGIYDKEFIKKYTEGFDEWKKSIELYTPKYAENITGVRSQLIIKAARIYGGSRKAGIFYAMGITQHTCGTDNVYCIANLALLTGNIGRYATGINPLRGQNNVQGASDSGCLPDLYPGYQKVTDKKAKEKIQSRWGVTLSDRVGLKSTEIADAILSQKIRAIYIMGENPVLAEPNQKHLLSAFKKIDFLIVQDIFMTDTARYADVILPSACFAEKDGTFTNTERRIQRIRKALEPPLEAKTDLEIIMSISESMGYPMRYKSAREVFDEYRSLWKNIKGVDYERLNAMGIQWPCISYEHKGTQYLYKNGFPNKRLRFHITTHSAPYETCSEIYQYILTTGRNLYQYHYGSMTSKVKEIDLLAGEPYIEINHKDAEMLGIKDGNLVRVSSKRSSIELKSKVTDRIPKGVVFIPIHYNKASVNKLTVDAFDRITKTPEFKVCSVKIEPV